MFLMKAYQKINSIPTVVKDFHGYIRSRCLYFLESEFVSIGVDFDYIAVGKFSGQKFGGQRILQPLLDGSFERSCPEVRIITFVHDLIAGIIREFNLYAATTKTLSKITQLNVHDFS